MDTAYGHTVHVKFAANAEDSEQQTANDVAELIVNDEARSFAARQHLGMADGIEKAFEPFAPAFTISLQGKGVIGCLKCEGVFTMHI